MELAKRLKAAGAKMYGAFWCSHCFEQKQTFGKEAMAEFPYVECYPDGYYKVHSFHCVIMAESCFYSTTCLSGHKGSGQWCPGQP